MKRILQVLLLSCCLGGAYAAEEVPAAAKALIPTIEAWGDNPVLVAAVSEQNSSGLSLAKIKSLDASWRKHSGVNDVMKALMENKAAKALAKLEASNLAFFEAFLMDNQGANVAMTNKTSDYWQGDEAKFIESFNNGVGATHLGEVEFDESTQAYLVQISVPIRKDGKAIGVLTVGINIDEL